MVFFKLATLYQTRLLQGRNFHMGTQQRFDFYATVIGYLANSNKAFHTIFVTGFMKTSPNRTRTEIHFIA